MRVGFWVLVVSFELLARTSAATRPTGVRGGNHDIPNNKVVYIFNYVYGGGLISRDFEGFPEMVPNDPIAVTTQTHPHYILSSLYQLPADGTTLPPDLFTEGEEPQFPFSAILRYHTDNPAEIQRVREWIHQHIAVCQMIFVINYPVLITSPEARSALDILAKSFLESEGKVRVLFAESTDPNGDNNSVPSLLELLKYLSSRDYPHKVMIPPPIVRNDPEEEPRTEPFAPWMLLLNMLV